MARSTALCALLFVAQIPQDVTQGAPAYDFQKVQSLVHRAGLASSFKDYAESAQLYSEASQLMGATVNVVLEQRLGDALMHTHEYERAYVAYQRALSIPPSRTNTNATQHAHGLVRAAAAATYTGRIAEALERLVHLLENDARGLFFPSSSGAELAWAAIAQIGGSEGGSGTHLPQQVRQRLVATAVRLFVSRDSRVRASRPSSTLAAGDGRRPLWSERSYKGAETHTGGRNVTADLGECQFLDEMPWLDAASIEDAVGLYARFHAASLGCCATARADGQARVDEGAHPLRMLVYRPSDAGEGWGNRLLSLSSSFVLAMATRRVFLVNWTEPTELSYLLAAPSGIDWSFAAASERCRRAGGRREEVTEAGFGAFMSFSLEQVYSDKQGILSRNHETGSRGADSGLLYSSLHDLFRPIKTLKAFAWFRRLCRQRRREAAGEDGWGPVGLGDGGESKWELFACTGWYLFAPSARVEAAMALRTKTLALQQDAGKSLVGVAVRRGSKLTSHYSVINRAGQDAILRCAALVLLGSGPGSRVVLATDSNEALAAALKMLGPSRLAVYNSTIAYSGSGEKQRVFGGADWVGGGKTGEERRQGLIDATVEWFLLGECDDVVLSQGSSFGQTAWARTLKHMPIEIGNYDLQCARVFGDDPTEVVDSQCCAQHVPTYGLGAAGPCPRHCVLR